MPYIMNQLGLIYMTAAADGKTKTISKSSPICLKPPSNIKNRFLSRRTSAAYTCTSDS